MVDEYKQSYPELGSELARILEGKDAVEFQSSDFPAVENGYSQATRNSSQDALNVIADKVPTFLGGSADLAHSNMTYIKSEGLQDDEHRLNRNIQFGVREFAMGAILNGMSLHGGLRVYGGTFFVFSDYVKQQFVCLHFKDFQLLMSLLTTLLQLVKMDRPMNQSNI